LNDKKLSLSQIAKNILPSVVVINTNSSTGAGFILDENGYILTNYHIISNKKDIKIKLYNDVEFNAEVIGSDELNDISLLKIKPNKALSFVTIEENFKLADEIIAIGNPYNFGLSISDGIISGLNRKLKTSNFNYIQINASINRGSSGGPLFNSSGKLIGMVVATKEEGISFAVPIREILPIVEELKEYGYIKRGWIGLKTENLSQISNILNVENGVIITNIVKDSPAESSGLLIGDIVISSNNQIIASSQELDILINSFELGSKIPLTILRKNKLKDFSVKIIENTDFNEDSYLSKAINIFDMFVIPINKEVRNNFQLGNINGAYVLWTKEYGIAAKNGIKKGDIVLSINQNNITDEDSIYNSINQIKNSNFLIVKDNINNRIVVLYD
jgi:serine protease Do